jgi:flagellar hook-associated protein 1 FlgK
MSNSIFGIGISGLGAAQAGLLTTGHNITNASTPGYNRQEIIQTPGLAQRTGSGYFGQGVNVSDVRRAYDALLQAQSWQAQASSSHLDALGMQLGRIDSVLADQTVGLSPALSAFFGSVNDVASHPSDGAARQGLLSQAQVLSSRFHELDNQFEAQRNDVSRSMVSIVGEVNSITGQISEINGRIVRLSAAGSASQTPNDLLDQRDQLVSDLSKLVKVQVVKQDDNSYNIYLGSGQAIVLKDGASKLKVADGDEDPRKQQIVLQGAGANVKMRTSDLLGGKLGGLLEFQESALDPAQNALGRIAMALASAVNDQHQLGQDNSGQPGTALFSVGTPQTLPNGLNSGNAVIGASISNYAALTTSDYRLKYDGSNYTVMRMSDKTTTSFASLPQTVDGVDISLTSGAMAAGDSFLIEPTRAGVASLGVLITDVNRVAAAAPIRSSASLANTSGAKVSAGTVNPPAPANANLQSPVTITFTSAGTFDVSGTGTGNPAGVAYTDGGNIIYNGWTIQISGTPAAGDVFTVGPNTAGIGDNRNALALAGLQSQLMLDGGAESLQGAYAQIVSDIGNKAQEANVSGAAQASLLGNVETARQSGSGVNLDEEAANLMRYQQAYQASGKIIAIAGQLFDTILQLGR